MDLNIFKKNEPGDLEHYWSLVIGKNWVQAAIWRVIDSKAEVIAEGGIASWQEGNDESLVVAADSSLSSAASKVGEDVSEPNKVVFGLPPLWVEDGNIKEEHLDLLKKLSGELELSPAGFVILSEAISHFLKVREGAPFNGILVGLDDDTLDVTLVQNGKILGSVEVARSVSMGTDITEGLSKIERISQYPSRILLYDYKTGNLDDAKQNILASEWKNINFIHTPKVDILPPDIAISAVSLAGAAEVGQATQIILPNEKSSQIPAALEEDLTPMDELPKESELQEISPEELGFVEGVDIAHQDLDMPKRPVDTPPTHAVSPNLQNQYDFDPVHPNHPGVSRMGKQNIFSKIFSVFGFIPSLFSKLPIGLPRIPVRLPKGGGMVFGGVATLLFLVILGIAYWFLPKATVTIYIAPKTLEETMDITLDTGSSATLDLAKKVIPAESREVSVQGEKTTSSSGTKTVGDRAKGTVTIFHVGGSTLLKSGTVLTGPNGLKFTLNEDTNVASGSSLTNQSKTQAAVTAGSIGAEYNLASGSEFSVGNFSKSDFVAQNEAAMTGGTSREVSAVSEADIASLKKDLVAELTSKGLDQLKGDLSESDTIVDDSAVLEVTSEDYSNKAGDEVSTVKLTLKAKVKITLIPRAAMDDLIKAELEKDVPEGFALKANQVDVTYKAKPVPKSTGKTQTETPKNPVFTANVVANLLPKVNPDEISEKIAGKYPDVAKEYLATIPGFTRAEINFSFKFPSKLGTLPRITKNIQVEVSAER